MYTEDTIQQVRDLAAADIIGRRLKLQRSGSRWKVCCPFHNDKSASFMVTPSENIWKCFGCNKGGDAIAFVQEYEHVEFNQAIEIIAQESGITLGYVNDNQTKEERQQKKDEKQQMYDLLEWACKLYQTQIEPQHKELLYERGVTNADILKWRIGYAPAGFRLLTGLLTTDGKLPLALKLDLVKEKEHTGGDVEYYDTFRNRIMLPICDDQDRVIGFGAWACEGLGWKTDDIKKYGKYINSAVTPLFNKSEVLYGLQHAKKDIIKLKKAGITEGYFDVITAHRCNLNYVIASCGTALTMDHLKKLRKWSISKVEILQDNDDAGMEARMKSVDMVLESGMMPEIGHWDPEVKDLDNILRKITK